jgi:hypothetical protein
MTDQVAGGEQINTEAPVVNEEATTLVGGSKVEEVVNEAVVETKTEGEAKIEEKVIEDVPFTDFTLPEGVVLDEGFNNEFKGIAKELNLNQEQAQKLVDLQTKFTQGYSETINSQFKTQVEAWGKETIAELGPDYKQQMSVVAKAIDAFGTPELRTLLNQTGLGNHKEVAKLFLNIGNRISEDKMKDSNMGKDRATKSIAEKFYPNTKSIN